MAATDSLLEAIEKTEDAIDDQMLVRPLPHRRFDEPYIIQAVLEGSVNGNRAVPIDFAQHMSSLLSQPSSSEAEAPQQERWVHHFPSDPISIAHQGQWLRSGFGCHQHHSSPRDAPNGSRPRRRCCEH